MRPMGATTLAGLSRRATCGCGAGTARLASDRADRGEDPVGVR